MFTIYVKKDALEFEREVENKEQFVDALGTLYDMMEEEIKSKNKVDENEIRRKVEEEFWKEILDRTNFDDEEAFLEWLDLMKRKGLQEADFDFDEFAENAANEYIKDNSDYYDLDEMNDAIEELQSALADIYNIAGRHC